MKSLSPRQRSKDRYLYQFDFKNDFLQYFSLGDHTCTLSFRSIFFIIQPISIDLGFPFVDRAGHYSSAYPIRRPPKSFVSCGNQDSTVQGSSPHKYCQKSSCSAFNTVVTAFPSPQYIYDARPYHWSFLEGHLNYQDIYWSCSQFIRGDVPLWTTFHSFSTYEALD